MCIRLVTIFALLSSLVAAPDMARASGAVSSSSSLPGRVNAGPFVHPGVLASQSDYDRLLAHQKDPTVHAALALLEKDAGVLTRRDRPFQVTYDGVDLQEIMRRFSLPPDGAAPAALRLALYAFLASRRHAYGNAALARQAEDDARAILVHWATSGFRLNGQPIRSVQPFSSKQSPDAITRSLVGLQVGRGMVDYGIAFDLLSGTPGGDGQSAPVIKAFLANQLTLLLNAYAYHLSENKLDCARFDNQTSTQLTAILVLARLLDRADILRAAAGQSGNEIALSWPQLLDGAIYGNADHPRSCFDGAKADPHLYSQTDHVALGEIVDRFRAKPHQSFGYTLGSLTTLLESAVILERSGFSAYGFVGDKGQSLRSALHYYAFYLDKYVSDTRSRVPQGGVAYPSFDQYSGKELSLPDGATVEDKDQVLTPFILALGAFPDDEAVRGVLKNATRFPKYTPFYAIDPMLLASLDNPGLGR